MERRRIPWWTSELSIRRLLCALRNRFQRALKANIWDLWTKKNAGVAEIYRI